MELRADPVVASLEMSALQGGEGDGDGDGSDGACSEADTYESLPLHASFSTHMTAGAVAGVLEHTVMYPVDSVKVTFTPYFGAHVHMAALTLLQLLGDRAASESTL